MYRLCLLSSCTVTGHIQVRLLSPVLKETLIMRNSSIVLSVIGLSILVFGLITAQLVENQQVASIALLVSVAVVGVSTLVCGFSLDSDLQKQKNRIDITNELESIWKRFDSVDREIFDENERTHRWVSQEFNAINRQLDECSVKNRK